MNLPNLPTDNLYKFLALSGVVLCIACLILSTVSSQDFSKHRVAVLTELTDIEKELNEIDVDDSNVQASQQKIDVINNRIRVKETEIKDLNEIYNTTTLNLKMGIQIGFIASLTGFAFWYFKVQRYEDQILRAKSPAPIKKSTVSKLTKK